MLRDVGIREIISVAPGQEVIIESDAAAAVTGLEIQRGAVEDGVSELQRNASEIGLATALGNCPKAESCEVRLLRRRLNFTIIDPIECIVYCPREDEACKELTTTAAKTASAVLDEATKRIKFWVGKEVERTTPIKSFPQTQL